MAIMTTKRLFRSENNKIVAGILGGLGEYLDVDPVLLRLLYAAITVFTGVLPGLVVYVLAIVIVPRGPAITVSYDVPAQGEEVEDSKTASH